MDAENKFKQETLNEQELPSVSVQIHIAEATNWRQQFVEDYNTCCLCGTELYFTHVTNFSANEVTEEAFCECCRIRTRKDQHSLQ